MKVIEFLNNSSFAYRARIYLGLFFIVGVTGFSIGFFGHSESQVTQISLSSTVSETPAPKPGSWI